MGCDIHEHREQKVDGVWVTADTWIDESGEPNYPPGTQTYVTDGLSLSRNYSLFGYLCEGVRRDVDDARPERGLPPDVSKEVKQSFVSWESDAHSASYITINEIKEALLTLTISAYTRDTDSIRRGLQDILDGFIGVGGEDQRFVFWFDN